MYEEDWWADTETFFINVPFDDVLVESKAGFVSHGAINSEFIDRCHRHAIRCFPYVTLYLASDAVQWEGKKYDVYQGTEFAKHKFYEVDEKGQRRPSPYGSTTTDGVGVELTDCYITCPNVQDYQDQMLRWISYVMERGADGVFLDSLRKRQPCFGQRLGVHAHIIPDPSDPKDASAQNHALGLLLTRVRDEVKKHRNDGRILGNSGDPLNLPLEFQQQIDSDMLEAYICGTKGVRSKDWRPNITWDQAGRDLQEYLARKKRILVTSYINFALDSAVEDAFFCFASARLADFIWTCQPAPTLKVDQAIRRLFALNLGRPVTEEMTDKASGIYYRVFERGVVAVNSDSNTTEKLTLPASVNPSAFVDVLTNTSTTVLIIPQSSGRIFLFGATRDYGVGVRTQ
jgi:hypothetical protein